MLKSSKAGSKARSTLEIEQEYRVAYQEYQSKTQNDEDVTDSAEGETPKYRELSKELGRIRNE